LDFFTFFNCKMLVFHTLHILTEVLHLLVELTLVSTDKTRIHPYNSLVFPPKTCYPVAT